MSPGWLEPSIAAVIALFIGWLAAPLFQGSPLAARARALRPAPKSTHRRWRRRADRIGVAIADRFSAETVRAANARARAAGWAAPAAGATLLAAGVVLPVALPVLAIGILLVQPPTSVFAAIAIVLGAALVGRIAPALWVANMTERRMQAIAGGLPDAIDLLVICAESGVSLDVALTRTGRELGNAQPALAAELAMTATELGFLPRRADAFANLVRRVPLMQVQALADMLVQTERYGTPLAQALRLLAAEYRTTRLLRAEEKAARLPALMTVPMIAFILPPLFIVLIGPAIIAAMAG